MRFYILILALLISPVAIIAQQPNTIIFDEMVNQNILYGELSTDAFQLEPFRSWYNEGYNNYQPDEAVVEAIKPLLQNVTFELIVASWCPDSKRETPRFIKLLDVLSLSDDKYTTIAVNRKKVSPEAAIDEGYIDYVPTFIIRRNNAELGRIVEHPTKSLEKDLLAILRKD